MVKDNKKPSGRRKFLKKFGGLALGSMTFSAGGMLVTACSDKDETGDKIKLLTPEGELIEVSKSQISYIRKSTEVSSDKRRGLPGKKFVMVIDLARCKNARKCMIVCQEKHQLYPEQHHINVLQVQDTEKTKPYFLPKPCQHCDNPPCVAVCPVGATFKRGDNLVLIDNQRCIGCRFCIATCRYSARVFNWKEPKDAEKYKDVPYDLERNFPQRKGTVTKCNFSADKLRKNELPYCVTACPNGVFWFGDANENSVTNGTSKKTTILSDLLEEKSAFQLMTELGTKPNIFYLPPTNRLFKFDKYKDIHNA